MSTVFFELYVILKKLDLRKKT